MKIGPFFIIGHYTLKFFTYWCKWKNQKVAELKAHHSLLVSVDLYNTFVHSQSKTGWTWVSVISRSPVYQPVQKFLILTAANYLQTCCFWAKIGKLICWYPGWEPRVISVQPIPCYWHYVHLNIYHKHQTETLVSFYTWVMTVSNIYPCPVLRPQNMAF